MLSNSHQVRKIFVRFPFRLTMWKGESLCTLVGAATQLHPVRVQQVIVCKPPIDKIYQTGSGRA